MKKFALIPALALLFLGACSEETDEPNPVPDAPVVSVQPVADQVTLDIPNQNETYERDIVAGSACYKFSYDNGQILVLDIDTSTLDYTFAIVRKVEGEASEVVIPPTCRAKMNDEYVDIPIICINLYQESVADCVKKITIASSADKMLSLGTYTTVNSDYLTAQVKKCPSVEKFELQSGFASDKFVCNDGAIYSGDFTEIVAVPRAYEGVFTVADGVKNVSYQCFFNCNKITGITFPASVESIGDEAVLATDKLGLINMLSEKAPTAESNSFGHYAFDGVLRVPAGCKDAYYFAVPDLEIPIEPAEPAWDASDEEWDEYDEAYAEYLVKLAEYNNANEEYDTHCVFNKFKNVEEANF